MTNIYKTMSYVTRCAIIALLVCWFGNTASAQNTKVKVGEIEYRQYERIEDRVYILYELQEKGYLLEAGKDDGIIDVLINKKEGLALTEDDIDDFFADLEQITYEWQPFSALERKAERVAYYVMNYQSLDTEVFNKIDADYRGGRSSENATCATALPFCTDNGEYHFYPGVDSGSPCGSEYNSSCSAPYDGCSYSSHEHHGSTYDGIATAPNPAFYYMRIGEPGNLDIYMEGYTTSGGSLDIDFVCWGPFANLDEACNLSCDNMIDASYHYENTEDCYIDNAQTGQYYMLLITNYGNKDGEFTFSNIGTGTTDCGIMASTYSNSPICVGDTLVFHANSQAGATFHWSGPNGWTSSQQNPTRPNVTLAMSGTYSVYVTKNSETSETTYLQVEVLDHPTPNFSISEDGVCVGEPVTFTDQSTISANGGSITGWEWDFGDGHTATTQNATHSFYSGGTYNVSLTATNAICDSTITKTINIISERTSEETAAACSSYTWHGNTYTASGNYTDTLSGGTPDPIYEEKCITEDFESVTATNYTATTANLPAGWVGFSNGAYDPRVSNNSTASYDPFPTSNTSNYLYMMGKSSGSGTSYAIMPKYESITSASFKCAVESKNYGTLTVGYVTSNTGYNTFQELRTITFSSATTTQTITLTDAEITTINNNNGYIAFRWVCTSIYSVGIDDVSVCHIAETLPEAQCLETVTLHLTINDPETESYNATACDSYTWHGQTYGATGIFNYETTTAQGCTRIETLNLTINNSDHTGSVTDEACDSYTWHGQTYTQSGNYEYHTQTTHDCDSTVTLHLTINNSNLNGNETYETCDSYTWHGQTYTQSGNYEYHTQTAHGCDSTVTLHLTINNSNLNGSETMQICDSYTWHGQTYTQSGNYEYHTQTTHGCDSTVTLHLTINDTEIENYSVTNCDSYTWHGTTYETSGNYSFDTVTAEGCPLTEKLNLTINNSDHTGIVTYETCDSYTWHGQTYTQSDNYEYHTQTTHGCDSTVTLYLTINNSTTFDFNAEACNNYVWDGTNYNATGNYQNTYQTTHGCDSTVTLHLTIASSIHNDFTVTECDSYVWDGTEYTTSNDYDKLYQTEDGCDSLVTMHLTINNSKTHEFAITSCDSYVWDGTEYTTSNDYTKSYHTVHGCDSVVTMHLTINYQDQSTTTITECDSYTWNGQTYTESGVYEYNTHTVLGCDSTAKLLLTVNHSDHTGSLTVTHCEDFTWNGTTYTQSGNYEYHTNTVLGCDSTATLHLTINYGDITGNETMTACDSYTWNGQTYTQSGIYEYPTQTIFGCDSLAVLNLTVNHSDQSSATVTECDNYFWNGQNLTQSGHYEYNTQTVHGCDSVAKLDLTIYNSEYPVEVVKYCDSYPWNGQEYTTTGTYTYQTQTESGCERIETLQLTIVETPNIEIDGQEWPISGSETSYSSYDYTIIPLNSTTEFDSVTWQIDAEGWYIIPYADPTSAELRIFSYYSDTLLPLIATAYGECGSMTDTIWLKPSYYGIEENNAAQISITPNPNKGMMEIHLDNLNGNTEVNVVDITGNHIDSFVIGKETSVYQYDMREKATGVYNFIFTNGKATITKRVVVSK